MNAQLDSEFSYAKNVPQHMPESLRVQLSCCFARSLGGYEYRYGDIASELKPYLVKHFNLRFSPSSVCVCVCVCVCVYMNVCVCVCVCVCGTYKYS